MTPADGMASTVIQGRAKLPICNAQRLLLEFFVYGSPLPATPAGPFGLPPSTNGLPPAIAAAVKSEVEKNWECTDEKNDESGLRAQCWEAKDRHQNPHSCCDPTLIFRGSRDLSTHCSDIAMYFKVEWLGRWTSSYDFCLLPSLEGVAPGQPDQTVWTEYGPVNVPGDQTKTSQGGFSAFNGQTQAGLVRQRLQQAGWEKFTIIDETQDVQAPSMALGDPISMKLRLTVEVWAGQNGDWVNNFRQGWGAKSKLYNLGMKFAMDHVSRLQSA